MTNYWISELELKDLSTKLIKDIENLLAELSPGSIPNVTVEHLKSVMSTGHIFVTRDVAANVIGMATLVVYSKPTGKVGMVEDVVVKSQVRRYGIGRDLMEKLIERARLRGVKYLDLTSNPSREAAHKLYLSLGFTVRETTNFSRKL